MSKTRTGPAHRAARAKVRAASPKPIRDNRCIGSGYPQVMPVPNRKAGHDISFGELFDARLLLQKAQHRALQGRRTPVGGGRESARSHHLRGGIAKTQDRTSVVSG